MTNPPDATASNYSIELTHKNISKILESTEQSSVQELSMREFEFNDEDFKRVCQMIMKVAGIALSPSKKSMVYSRLVKRLRERNLQSFSLYLDELTHRPNHPEWEFFTNALTTNLTSFYREGHHFEILKKQLNALSHKSRIELWCCAASSGEEPYTMAITAMEAFNSMTPPVRITATDIDTHILSVAKQGKYRGDQLDKMPPDMLKKYFLIEHENGETVATVKPEVKALITFRKLNLIEPMWQMRAGFDAIFCRNVMIYFEKETQLQILSRFAPLLNGGGLLYAGHSENFTSAKDLFTLKGKTVYEVMTEKSCKGSLHQGFHLPASVFLTKA